MLSLIQPQTKGDMLPLVPEAIVHPGDRSDHD
jgi:hypothetical protein